MIIRKTTQESLGESFRELAHSKPVDKISVKEIAQNCGVTTATFYRYFQDKYDLLAWILNTKDEQIFLKYAAGELTWRDTIEQAILILWNDQAFYSNALKNAVGQNSFFSSTKSYTTKTLSEIFQKRTDKKTAEELLFYLEFWVRGASMTAAEWVQNGYQLQPEVLIDRLYKSTPTELLPYLE